MLLIVHGRETAGEPGSAFHGPCPAFARRAGDVAWRAAKNFVDQEGMQWAGAVAFFLALSVPPLVIAAFSIGVAVVGESVARDYVVGQVTQFLPAQQEVVRRVATQTISASEPAIPLSLAFLLFSGSRVFASLIAAINVMWRELPEPGFVRRQLTRLVMLVTTGVLFTLAGATELAVAFADSAIPPAVSAAVRAQLLPVALLLVALLLLFKLVPRGAASWQSAVIGAVVGTALLRLAQAGFTAYLRTLGNFESAYGPLAGAAVIMTWALVASMLIVFAAHLVAVLNDADRRPHQPAHDSTSPRSQAHDATGDRRPNREHPERLLEALERGAGEQWAIGG
ncbi:MAG: YihY/virulence factor BrkB family protein [Chloroflexi bacterium]|nr:YihY/virulence factor BrkB family protein [Chloroflexota bacterium]